MSQDKLNSTDVFVGGTEHTDGNLRASEAISALDPVKYDGTETGNVPDVSVSDTAGENIAGIALVDAAASGDPITIAKNGAQVRANASGSISPGDSLTTDGNGAVNATGSSTPGGFSIVGQADTSAASNVVVMTIDGGGEVDG